MGARAGVWCAVVLWAAACAGGEDVESAAQTDAASSTTGDYTDVSSGPSPSSADASSSSTGGAGGAGGAGGKGGAGGMCDHPVTNACTTAEVLPDVAGDQGTDKQMVTGTTSKWFQIKVVEASSGPALVKYTVSLASPPDVDFDLFVTEGDANGPICGGLTALGVGEPATVSKSFSDQTGNDDSIVLSIEVRFISGPPSCAEWTLTVEGNV